MDQDCNSNPVETFQAKVTVSFPLSFSVNSHSLADAQESAAMWAHTALQELVVQELHPFTSVKIEELVPISEND